MGSSMVMDTPELCWLKERRTTVSLGVTECVCGVEGKRKRRGVRGAKTGEDISSEPKDDKEAEDNSSWSAGIFRMVLANGIKAFFLSTCIYPTSQ